MKTPKEEQKKDVEKAIRGIASDIAKSTSKVGESITDFEHRKKCAVDMLTSLCKMYQIAYNN